MSFGGNKPQPEAKPMGVATHRLSTNESARPVPYLAGRQRLGLSFISDVFNQRADAVTSNLGKQSTTSGYNYYASLMTLIGLGPLDALHDLIYNGDSVYTDNVPIYAVELTFSAGTGLATFRTQNPHGRTSGETLLIKGAVQGDYNGTAVITVTDATHFTYPVIGTPTSPATGTIFALLQLDPVERGAEAEVNILVPDFGPIILQWGTENQVTPLKLNASGTVHPDNRGLGCIFFDQTFLGFNQTNVQNLEGVFARFPQQDWLILDPVEGECNPIAFIVDLLQNPRMGIRAPTSKIDTATMAATAAQLATEGFGFSPLILRQQEARQILLEALDYFDGYLALDASGRLGVKLARGPVDDVPVITDSDLTARAEFAPEDWSVVKTGVNVKFNNRDVGYNVDVRTYRDAAALSIKGEPDIETVERPWITRAEVAEAYAKSYGRARALPPLPGRLKLRQHGNLFEELLPGALFKLNLSNRSLPYTIFRVTDRTLPNPARPEFEIGFKVDRSYLHAPLSTAASLPMDGLIAWYRAPDFITTPEAIWPDATGNGHHLTAVATAPVVDETGDFPVVRWNGTQQEMWRDESLYAGASQRTLVVVFQTDNADFHTVAGQRNLDGGTGEWQFTMTQTAAGYAGLIGYDTEISVAAAHSTAFKWAIASYDGSDSEIETADGTDSRTEVLNTDGFFIVGGWSGIGAFAGSIAEVLVYDHKLTTEERATLLAYLEAKFSL